MIVLTILKTDCLFDLPRKACEMISATAAVIRSDSRHSRSCASGHVSLQVGVFLGVASLRLTVVCGGRQVDFANKLVGESVLLATSVVGVSLSD